MKKIFILLVVMLAIITARGQIITGSEYFFDTDPGLGNGTPVSVTSGDSVIIATTVPTAGLAAGFHKLYFRVQNVDGTWSLYEGRTFYIQDMLNTGNTLLTESEYFFDTDPGIGNGTPFTVTPGDSIYFNTTVSTSALANGFHKLYVRARNVEGKWSLYEGRTFYIQDIANPNNSQLTAAEYFYDNDPGVGIATPLAVTSGDSLLINDTAPTTSLGEGFHTLFVRVLNAEGKWSLYEGRTFYIQQPPVDISQVQITYAEYFFDTDMGQGNSISFNITPGDSLDANFTVPETLSLGTHQMVVRCKNSLDKWSLSEGREFRVGWPGVTEIDPDNATLFQNYPNPFSSSTSIVFNLVKENDVVITISDLLGKIVKEITMANLSPGKHHVIIDKNDLECGYYFYKMTTKDFTGLKEMVLVK